MNQRDKTLDSLAYLLAAMRDRHDRIGAALCLWLDHHQQPIAHLLDVLGCNPTVFERLTLTPRPKPGRDWDDDVEIIAISLRIQHAALRAILLEAEQSLTHQAEQSAEKGGRFHAPAMPLDTWPPA